MDILTSDLSEGALPSELLTTLEREVPVAVEGVPRTKRHKLDEPNPPQLSLLDKVTICCALLRVLRGMAPQPRFWGALRSGGTERVRFILKVSVDMREGEKRGMGGVDLRGDGVKREGMGRLGGGGGGGGRTRDGGGLGGGWT